MRRIALSAALLALALSTSPLPAARSAEPRAPALELRSPSADGGRAPNRLSNLETASGWRLLFDGRTTSGWRGWGADAFPLGGWDVADGALHCRPGGAGGDLVTLQAFDDFELAFQWRVAPGGNGGVKYRVPPDARTPRPIAPEYQVLDDAAHPDGAGPLTSAASLYALAAAEQKPQRPAGAWNDARIVARGRRIEHWLNGARVLVAAVGSEEWEAARAASKFAAVQGFATPKRGHVVLQDHGDEVWYRDLRLRELPCAVGAEVALLAPGLAGWEALGDAVYELEGDTILGRVGGGGQSFLVTERELADFVLEVDVKTELPGNSGIQVRSHRYPTGRLYGYQIEIDPSERAWSGGLYDEARRGWLDDLAGDELARAAFRHGEWNRFRIECVGPWIRASVNGVPTADRFDPLDLAGAIGLQVHSGDNTRVRWRGLRVWEIGRHEWRAQPLDEQSGVWSAARNEDGSVAWELLEPVGDFALRVRFRGGIEARFTAARPRPLGAGESADPPGFASGDWGWRHAWPAPAKDERDEHVLSLCSFGGRVAVHQDGKQVADEPAGQLATRGRVRVTVRGPGRGVPGRLLGIERLDRVDD